MHFILCFKIELLLLSASTSLCMCHPNCFIVSQYLSIQAKYETETKKWDVKIRSLSEIEPLQ